MRSSSGENSAFTKLVDLLGRGDTRLIGGGLLLFKEDANRASARCRMFVLAVPCARLVDLEGVAASFFFVDHSANSEDGRPSIARVEVPPIRGDFFVVDQSVKRDWNFLSTCWEDISRGSCSMCSRGNARGVVFGLGQGLNALKTFSTASLGLNLSLPSLALLDSGMGENVRNTFSIASFGLTLPPPLLLKGATEGDVPTRNRTELPGATRGIERLALDVPVKPDNSTALLADLTELRTPTTDETLVEVDGVMALVRLDELEGVLSPDDFAFDPTLVPGPGLILPAARWIPYFGKRDLALTVGLARREVATTEELVPPIRLLVLDEARLPVALVREGTACAATAGFLRRLACVSVGSLDDLKVDLGGASDRTFFRLSSEST